MAWIESVASRQQNSRTWVDAENSRCYALCAVTSPIHYEAVLDSRAFGAVVDLRPERVTSASLDGWKAEQAAYTMQIGNPASKGVDGWMIYGRRGCSLGMRAYRMGYFDWKTRAFTDLGGEAAYNRDNHEQIVTPLEIGPNRDLVYRHTLNRWTGLWKATGDVSLEIVSTGAGVKPNIRLDEKARDWTQLKDDGLYFGFLYQLDLADIPALTMGGVSQSKTGIIYADKAVNLWAADSKLIGSLPPDRVYVPGAIGPNSRAEMQKCIWYDNGWYMFVGLPISDMSKLAAGSLVFDPTVDVEVGADADDGYIEDLFDDFTNTACAVGTVDSGGQLYAHAFMRFTGVTLAGTITTSNVKVWPNVLVGTPETIIYAVDEDNPAAPTTYSEANTDPLTTASVEWDGPFTTGAYRTSGSLNTICQELVDSYISNDAVMLQIRNHHAAAPAEYFYFDDYGDANPAQLYVEYSAGGETYNLAAVLLAASATPTGSVLSVARAVASILSGATATPDSAALDVARAAMASIVANTVTPDDATVAALRLLNAIAAAASTTTDSVMLNVNRAMDAVLTAAASTPDVAILAVARAMTATLAGDTATPDSVLLAVARGFAAGMAAETITPDDLALSVARAIAANILAQTVTPDTAILSVTGIVQLAVILAATSNTSEAAVLAIARPLAAGIAAETATGDAAALSLLLRMAATLAATSATTGSAVLGVRRSLSATLAAQSATPDVANLSMMILLSATLHAITATPDTATLTVGGLIETLFRGMFRGMRRGMR